MEATLTLKANDQISGSLKQVKANIQGLGSPLKNLGGGFVGLGKALKGTSDQAEQGAGRLKLLGGGIKQLAVGTAGLTSGLGKLALSAGRAGAALTAKLGRAALGRVTADLKTLGRAAADVTKSLIGLGARVAALGAGLTYGFKRVFVDLAMDLEEHRQQLANTLGGKTLVDGALQNIRNFSKATGRELKDVTAAFSTLAASGLKPTRDHLDALADMAAKKNLTLAETSEAFKRALKGEENALEEWGVKSKKIGKDMLYQYVDQAGKQVSLRARADNPRALGDLLNHLSGGVAGGAEAQRGDTMRGSLAKLSNKLSVGWLEFRALLMDSGPFQFLKDELSGVLKWVEKLEENGSLAALAKEWGEKLTGALKKVKEGLVVGWEWLKKWGPQVRDLISSIGGAKIAAVGLGAVLGGPLIGSIGKVIKSVGALSKALLLTPVGLLITAAVGIGALMHETGALTPFLDGLKEGFGGLKEAIGPALTGLMESLDSLFASMGLSLRDVNGNINPEGWRELGKAVAEFTNGTLAALIKMLTELVKLLTTVGEGLGKLAGLAMTGEDADAMNKALNKGNALDRRMRETMAAQGGKATPEQVAAWRSERDDIDHERKVAQGKVSRNFLGRASGLDAVTHGDLSGRMREKFLPDRSQPTPSDIQNPESITGPLSGKLDSVSDILSRPQDVGNL